MATSKISVSEGLGKNLATHSFSEDAVTKEAQRVVLNDSNGSEVISVVSTVNSSTTTLGIGGIFTGTPEEVTKYAEIRVSVFSNVASATDGLSIQLSMDGTNWDITDVFTIPASTGKTFGLGRGAKFFRVVYTNGGTGQTAFRLQTIYSIDATKPSSQRPQDSRPNDNDFEEVLGYNMLFNGTTWDRVNGDITNGMDVDVTRLPAITKGTQDTRGVATQDLKDAGRSSRTINLDSFAVVATAETLNTMSYSSDNGTATTGTSYTVTTAKRFRLQQITASLHTITGNTTAVNVIVRLRINNAGAAIVTSPIEFVFALAGVASANGASTPVTILIPDGYEIVAGAGIGVTTACAGFVTTTAAPRVNIAITGYEY